MDGVAVVVEELHLVVLDQRVGEQPVAHLVELRRVLHVELDHPAHMDVRHAGEPEPRERVLDRDLPWGSRIPAFGRVRTRARLTPPPARASPGTAPR